MEQRARVGNRLLAALPPADLDLLVRHFRMVELERDAVLVRSGDPIERIYFPLSGLIAFIMEMPNGQTVATAVVGNEAAVSLLTTLASSRSPMTAVVRVAGLALQVSPTRFHAALSRSRALNGAVQTHNRALMAQFQHVAACNALHSVEARLARWLSTRMSRPTSIAASDSPAPTTWGTCSSSSATAKPSTSVAATWTKRAS